MKITTPPAKLERNSRFGQQETITTPILNGEASEAGIETILLGLRTRGWLTESEMNLLGLLTNCKGNGFIYGAGRTFQPAELDRFTLEPIRVALSTCSHAVFSHRQLSDSTKDGRTIQVHTAIIDPEAKYPEVLGLISPEIMHRDDSSRIQFDNLLNRFRIASKEIEQLVPRVNGLLETQNPTLIISRTSGRILLANEPACSLLDQKDKTLIDREFGQIKRKLFTVHPGLTLGIKNINVSALNLSVITLKSSNKKTEKSKDPFMVDFFTHKLRNKISAITTSASHLEAISLDSGLTDQSELSQIILKEATEMDQFLSRLNLIMNFELLRQEPLSLHDELYGALRFIKSSFSENIDLIIRGTIPPLTVSRPLQSVMYLFDAVLQSQLFSHKGSSRSEISFSTNDSSLKIMILTTLQPSPKKITINDNWSQLATRLASVLKFKLSNEILTELNQIESTIEISTVSGDSSDEA